MPIYDDDATLARAEHFFPDSARESGLMPWRPDLSMMAEPSGRFVVATSYSGNRDVIWVFDAENETTAEQTVKPDPKVKCWFDIEITAMNICIRKLTAKGEGNAANPCGPKEEARAQAQAD